MKKLKRICEKYGWLVFLALGILWLVYGFVQAFYPERLTDAQHITGMYLSEIEASFPEATKLVIFLYGALGLLKISWSLLVLAITLTGYRRGEKWAWYTLWLVPAALVGQGIFNSVFLDNFKEMLPWIPITAVSLVGLFLPFRRFFPR
jgi:hypothetical protein